jgi:cell division protein FtsW (lipid II flippase)
MQAYVVSYSKYIIAAALAVYTLTAYFALPVRRGRNPFFLLFMQRFSWAVFMVNATLTLWKLGGEDSTILLSGALCTLAFLAFMLLFQTFYAKAHVMLFNNVCMMLSLGLVMVARINFAKAQKQFVIACAGLVFILIFPVLRKQLEFLRHLWPICAAAGLALIGIVLLSGRSVNGANLMLTLKGFTFQPSELVKILFLLFLAGAFAKEVTGFKVFLTFVIAMAHVGILVLSSDLGSAMIFYVVYFMMLYIATGRFRYLTWGALMGAVGAVACYFLFAHLRVRVDMWLDPWTYINDGGYQITQALFAISFGGLFGAGLYQGMPSRIPFVESDFIFAAIAEEMGLVTAACLVLLCLNIFIDILVLSEQYSNRFFRMFTFGTGVMYIFQTFVTVAGETKFIPLTGVTLPLVSYGGTSVLSTLILFGIVSAIFILHGEREDYFRMKMQEEKAEAVRRENARRRALQEDEDVKRAPAPRRKKRSKDSGFTMDDPRFQPGASIFGDDEVRF